MRSSGVLTNYRPCSEKISNVEDFKDRIGAGSNGHESTLPSASLMSKSGVPNLLEYSMKLAESEHHHDESGFSYKIGQRPLDASVCPSQTSQEIYPTPTDMGSPRPDHPEPFGREVRLATETCSSALWTRGKEERLDRLCRKRSGIST